jgi:hypothetical protein
MSASANTAPVRHAPLSLWRVAGALLTTLHHLFGDASDIAALHTVTARTRALMLPWLRAAEALLRRLLLVEASHYAREELAPARPRARLARTRRVVAFDPAKPDEWRVTFRCVLDRRRPRRRDAGGPRQNASRFHTAWPLAERYEALMRAYNDPAPYARRLARRLYAEPLRAAAILAHPLPEVGREQIEAATPLAEAACARFRTDSS